MALLYLARIELSAERTDCACRLAERALESAEAAGRAVYAAQAVALLAATTDREGEAFRLIDEACTIINQREISHNAFRAYGVPPENLIGTMGDLRFEIVDGAPQVTKAAGVFFIDDKKVGGALG